MKAFDYVRPQSLAEALSAAAEPGTVYLAAGTNLLDLMKAGVMRPERVVDITALPGLDGIEQGADGSWRIGALVRNADLAYHADIARDFPAVAEALLSGASPQLRNAATVGGNLLQRTRCRYFYDTASACNKREPGAGCDALEGENRTHAVLGWSDQCTATHPSDFCVPLAALDAVVELQSQNGTRDVALVDFYNLPGDTPAKENVLAPGELIVAVRLPREAAGLASHSRYLKLRERTSYAFALVSAAVGLDIKDGMIRSARIALGGVAPRPWRAYAAEEALVGAPAAAEQFRQAADAAMADATASGDNAFKIELGRRVVAQALERAAAGTPERLPALPASPFARVSRGAQHA